MSTISVKPLTGPAAWHGRDLARSTDWIHPISAAAVAELGAVAHELEHGPGLVLLRGLPVVRYTEDELRQLYWGIGAHLGTPRYQNAHGELIGEVRDELRVYGTVNQPDVEQKTGAPVTSRYKARSSGPLRFHTDRADVVGLLCVRQARSGGVSKIVSSVAINNAILERRPDLHPLLYQDYYRTREGEERGGDRRWYALPVFGVRAAGRDGRRALLRDGAAAGRHPALEQPRDLPRAHGLRGRRGGGARSFALSALALDAQQPRAAPGLRGAVGLHRAGGAPGRDRPGLTAVRAAGRRGARAQRAEARLDWDYFAMSSSSTSKTKVAPGLICGGRP